MKISSKIPGYLESINYSDKGSSAICIDIRNSTKLTRKIEKKEHLIKHTIILQNIKNLVFIESQDYVAINDTGDGFIALFWDEYHALRALRVGIAINVLIEEEIAIEYNKFIHDDLKIYDLPFDFGIGLHSGSSIVYRKLEINRDFMYGIVLNSAARLESFTKTFESCNFLLTGHFKDVLEKQFNKIEYTKKHNINFKTWFEEIASKISDQRFLINDHHPKGHILYKVIDPITAINNEFMKNLKDVLSKV